ncbi:hypothetical protein [Methylobacterium nodulans]|nr:hypothetical protein [Methylobacterium nodulans]
MISDETIVEWARILQSGNHADQENLYSYILSRAAEEDFRIVPLRITYFIHRGNDLQALLRVSTRFMSFPEFWGPCLRHLANNVCIHCGDPRSAVPYLDAAHRDGALPGEMVLFTAAQHVRIGNAERALSLIAEVESRFPELAREAAIHRQFVDLFSRFDYNQARRMLDEVKERFARASLADLEREIVRALDIGSPYLFLRLGDGEGSCTIIDADDEAAHCDYYRANRREFVDIWFKDESVLDDPEFTRAIEAFNEAIPAADSLGGIWAELVDHEYGLGSRRGIAWVVNTMRKVLMLADRDPAWAARTSMHTALCCTTTCCSAAPWRGCCAAASGSA